MKIRYCVFSNENDASNFIELVGQKPTVTSTREELGRWENAFNEFVKNHDLVLHDDKPVISANNFIIEIQFNVADGAAERGPADIELAVILQERPHSVASLRSGSSEMQQSDNHSADEAAAAVSLHSDSRSTNKAARASLRSDSRSTEVAPIYSVSSHRSSSTATLPENRELAGILQQRQQQSWQRPRANSQPPPTSRREEHPKTRAKSQPLPEPNREESRPQTTCPQQPPKRDQSRRNPSPS